MQRPNVDDDLTLLTGFGKTEAIVVEVLDNPATEEGVLLKVMGYCDPSSRMLGLGVIPRAEDAPHSQSASRETCTGFA